MLRLRIVSSVVGIPLILFSLWQGGILFALLLLGIALLAGRELKGILSLRLQEVWPYVLYPGLGLLLILPVYLGEAGTLLAIAASGLGVVVVAVVKDRAWAGAAATAFGLLYLGFLLGRLVVVREGPDGLLLAAAIILATWANDIVSYAAGRLVGERRLAPQVSPNKTVEGAVAGLAASVAAVEILFQAAGSPAGLTGGRELVLGLGLGLAAQLGDLFESQLKRTAGIKDSGALIPGHGGFLDRFDSLIFSSAAGYYLASFLRMG